MLCEFARWNVLCACVYECEFLCVHACAFVLYLHLYMDECVCVRVVGCLCLCLCVYIDRCSVCYVCLSTLAFQGFLFFPVHLSSTVHVRILFEGWLCTNTCVRAIGNSFLARNCVCSLVVDVFVL